MPPQKRRVVTTARQAIQKIATAGLTMKGASGKVGMTTLGNRAVPSMPTPQSTVAAGNNRSQTFAYFTKVTNTGDDIPVLYSGDRLWARVKLELQTAGPVVVGQSSQILPVTTGFGRELPVGREVEYIIAKGTKLYIASTSVNSVMVTVEPLPWLEQITAFVEMIASRLATGKK